MHRILPLPDSLHAPHPDGVRRGSISADAYVEALAPVEVGVEPEIELHETGLRFPLATDRIAWPKRALDVALATCALVLLAPVFLLVAALVALGSSGPVLYRQRRYGLGGRPFTILKFRTMVAGADERVASLFEDEGHRAHFRRHGKFPRDPRVTRVGRLLRVLSLDELPQLVNVLRGEMSLVGPRPRWSAAELQAYGKDLATYLSTPPGLTGPWQVSGRNLLPDERRVELDLAYARRPRVPRDLWYLLRTVPVLLWPFGRGAS